MTSPGAALVAGVDEAGRGPLAGPVVAAAVILRLDRPIHGLADSKLLSARKRETLFDIIRRDALASAIAWADTEEIDRLNILQATLLAMRRAVLGLVCRPAIIEVDGNRLPDFRFGPYAPQSRAIVDGDRDIAAISAASILAKVSRDRMMLAMDRLHPEYGFARHKGYGSAEHRACIDRYGPCPFHRRSFRPLRRQQVPGPQPGH
ncbi:MAG TPA: ribonuclease HII [Woeseiaceae bacterium]|nr:ribonuclease HII [Woeseiaceae bacterium]